MGRKISRRDFLHGAAGSLVAGAALASGCSPPQSGPPAGPVGAAGAPLDPATYPPSRLGLRGSHPGSFEVALEMAFEKRTDWGPADEPDTLEYDLVVVGAGISGLAAAFFYREQHPDARVLLLENHDDFGGHAKRNEFEWNGRTILGHGGSQSLQEPSSYSDEAKGLLARIGVEKTRLKDAYDQDFYQRNNLAAGIYFDRASYGTDRLVRTDLVDPSLFLPVTPSGVATADAIEQMPLSEPARRELQRLVATSEDRLPDHSIFREPGYLRTISYRDFLVNHLGVEQPEVIALLQDIPSAYWGHGIDVVPALDALGFGLPGLGSTSLGSFEGPLRRALSFAFEPYFYHFPDGNASVARLLVQHLIPGVAGDTSMEGVVTSAFHYSALDHADSDVRLRACGRARRCDLRALRAHRARARPARGAGLLQRGRSVPLPGTPRRAEGGASVAREDPHGLHERAAAELGILP